MSVHEIKGQQFGVRLEKRGENDQHIRIQLLGEDDENWFEIGNGFSNYWLDDLIKVLELARQAIQQYPKDATGFGHSFE